MGATIHIVQPGDTLSHIAKRNGTTVAAILKVNAQIKNPDIIRVGDKITMPSSAGPSSASAKPGTPPSSSSVSKTHVVRKGDTLSEIGAAFKVSVDGLMAANPQIKDRNSIHVGQVITIPAESGKGAQATTKASPKGTTTATPAKVSKGAAAATMTTPAAKDWAKTKVEVRMVYVMERLVSRYGYPVNASAGIVGNLVAESGVLPNRLEGSHSDTPLRARDFAGKLVNFSPEAIMTRSFAAKRGPKLPGIGLAQWTSAGRRDGLFRHSFDGRTLGAAIIFDMDAQIDYLVTELGRSFSAVNRVLTGSKVTMNAAADEVVYNFEIPGSILGQNGKKLPRSDARVQRVFGHRRASGQRALDAYRRVHP